MTSKPPYRVPSMVEINALPWNGYKVASTFSGCGGSCLGYRMAGFKVVWANEFVPAAQASYKANATPDCYLDCRDVRPIKPEEILARTGLNQGELDLFDGSPPCQAFSTAGKREKGWGKQKTYEHGAKQCNERLFDEYIRLLRGLMPKVFVAENVSGLVKGTAKGMFLEILKELKASGYKVEAKLLDAQWLGVPQMRQRIIFVGVRNDLQARPAFPMPLPYRYSVREALSLPPSTIARRDRRGGFGSEGEITDEPSPAILAGTAGNLWIEGANGFNGHAMMPADGPMPTVQAGRPVRVSDGPTVIHDESGQWSTGDVSDSCSPCTNAGRAGTLSIKNSGGLRKMTIAELRRICSFPDDFILHGSYAQQWERLGNCVPPVMMSHVAATIKDRILGD